MVKVVIVGKDGECRDIDCTDCDKSTLLKKCGLRKADGFEEQHVWTTKLAGEKHRVAVYGKTTGKHNVVNKFEFPPPTDTMLFYGNCALVNRESNGDCKDIDTDLWEAIYTKLFGGFEDLADTAVQDEAEPDELANVPDKYKTKEGFLKDGFVVDNDSDEVAECTDKTDTESDIGSQETDEDEDEEHDDDDDDGSELAAEEYSYSLSDE